MLQELFKGKLVQLKAINPKALGNSLATWGRDSEFKRLLDSDPPRLYSSKASKEWLEKELKKNGENLFYFAIHAVKDDRLLGDIELEITSWGSREAFVGVGIGERKFWGKGYGTEAMQLILRYAFAELNLRRVSLNVFEFNQRAIRSYEKAGFRHEGVERQAVQREGQRWDVIYMGILREEWMEKYEQKND